MSWMLLAWYQFRAEKIHEFFETNQGVNTDDSIEER